jgi:hypothetical protein
MNYGVQVSNVFPNLSGASLNNKFLYTQVSPYPTGLPTLTVNNVTTAGTVTITGHTASNINAISLGTAAPSSGGSINVSFNAGAEVAEIMIFGRPLTAGEQTQFQNYLKDKWRYDEWAVIPPSPTPTTTSTNTPTPTNTQTNTPTTTSTNTPTPTTTTTPTTTPTPSATPAAPLVFSIISSASTKDDACSGSTSTTIYADDLGLCGPCTSGGLNCFACITTSQNVYADAGRTILAADGWYKNEMAPGNFGITQILSGKFVGGTFNNPPCP